MEREWVGVVVRAQVGEREAVAELVRGWHEAVWGHVRRMLGKDEVADEVAQEVWVAVVKGLPRLRQPEGFAAWLFTIARRAVMNQLRDQYPGAPAAGELPVGEEPEPRGMRSGARSTGWDRQVAVVPGAADAAFRCL